MTLIHARLSTSALSVADCMAAVADPRAGGTGLFVGTVRDHDQGRGVEALRYQAHPSAEAMLTEVCERFATADVLAIAVEHRTGDLAIGDIAVVVAVSSAHRDTCLIATHQLIDAVKTEVPIWKEQRFADGESEWVGEIESTRPGGNN